MRLLAIVIVSIAIHLAFGWLWTIFAGILAGMWVRDRGRMVASAGVGLGWALLTGYSFILAPAPTYEMITVVGGVFGNLPAPLVVVITVLIGCLIGGLGGLIGNQLMASVERRRNSRV